MASGWLCAKVAVAGLDDKVLLAERLLDARFEAKRRATARTLGAEACDRCRIAVEKRSVARPRRVCSTRREATRLHAR